jgi:hypothetical protein
MDRDPVVIYFVPVYANQARSTNDIDLNRNFSSLKTLEQEITPPMAEDLTRYSRPITKTITKTKMSNIKNDAGKTEGSTPLHHRQPATSTAIASRYNTVVLKSASERTIEAHAVHMIAIQLPMKAKPKPKTDLFGLCRYERSEIRHWRTWLDGEYGWELECSPESLNQATSASAKGGLK